MAAAFVQVGGTSNPSNAVTTGLPTVGTGNLLVVCVGWGSATDTIDVTDSNGGTPAAIAGSLATDATHGFRSQLFYIPNTVAGTHNVTATVHSGSSLGFLMVSVLEYSGLLTASVLDASNAGIANGSAPSVSLTTVADHSLVVAFTVVADAPPTAGSGFTVRDSTAGNPTEDQLDKATAGSVTAAFVGSETWWIESVASFRTQAPSAGSSIVSPVQTFGPGYATTRAASI
jgi:hypothetical protein